MWKHRTLLVLGAALMALLIIGISTVFIYIASYNSMVISTEAGPVHIDEPTQSLPKKQLKMLHIILRHGARTPADTFPKDPHINESFYPVGWGQLTNVGKNQMYSLGLYLRERYDQFLGEFYTPRDFIAQSTDVDRTRCSLQLINAGLWPPRGSQIWSVDGLNWQPIPIHFEPLAQDSLLLVRKPCAQYHLERQKLLESSQEIRRQLSENSELFATLSEITGTSVKNFDDVQDVYSTLTAEVGYNLTVFQPLKALFPERLLPPTVFSFHVNAYTDKLVRLTGGVLLKKLLEDWKKMAHAERFTSNNNTVQNHDVNVRKTYLYGGHDSTIVNILRALNVWEPHVPNYGATVLLEFSYNVQLATFGVEVFYRNTTSTEPPYKLTVPGCADFCPLDQLVKLTRAVIPVDWEAECKSTDGNYRPPEPASP